MPVIMTTVSSLALTAAAVIARAHPKLQSRAARRLTRALTVLASTVSILAAIVLCLALSVSNTPLADDVANVVATFSGGYRESRDVPDDLRGSVVLYFKPGCDDCAAVWNDLVAAVEEARTNDVYFVNTKSPTGRDLLARYPVEEVPAGVYVALDDNNTPYFHATLFTTDARGTHFRWESLNFLLRCKAQEW